MPPANVEHDPVRRAIPLWYGGLSNWMQAHARRGVMIMQSCEKITVGSIFSGADIATKILHKLSSFWSTQTSVRPMNYEVLFQCELCPMKRSWLEEQFPEVPMLFSDAAQLAEAKTLNLKTGEYDIIPSVDILTAGFSCRSCSKLNSSSSLNKGCVRQGTAETGQTFACVRQYMERKQPRLVILENVMELAEGGAESDQQYIVDTLAKLGYACEAFPVEALDYGSFVRRLRLYFVAYQDATSGSGRLAFVRSMLDDMKLARGTFAISDFTCNDSELLLYAAMQNQSRQTKKEGSFESEHATIFLEHGWHWPLGADTVLHTFGHDLSPLAQRAQEVVYIAHMKHPMPPETTVQFLDANCSWERIQRKPWTSDKMFTIVGSTKAVMRYKDGQKTKVRPLLGRELMALAGWSREDYQGDIEAGTTIADEVLSSLAGNAFSAFAGGAVMAAAVCMLFFPESDIQTGTARKPAECFAGSDPEDSQSSSETLGR